MTCLKAFPLGEEAKNIYAVLQTPQVDLSQTGITKDRSTNTVWD